jgi:hypothetical protein
VIERSVDFDKHQGMSQARKNSARHAPKMQPHGFPGQKRQTVVFGITLSSVIGKSRTRTPVA